MQSVIIPKNFSIKVSFMTKWLFMFSTERNTQNITMTLLYKKQNKKAKKANYMKVPQYDGAR